MHTPMQNTNFILELAKALVICLFLGILVNTKVRHVTLIMSVLSFVREIKVGIPHVFSYNVILEYLFKFVQQF